MLVAVYGTLKQGYYNYRSHLEGLRPLQSRFVEIPFRMYAGDSYPMIVSSPDRYLIFVEVFDVDADTLEKLDQLEAPYNFHRESVYISELNGDVQIYVFNEPEPPSEFTAVESGKWPG